MPGRLPLRAKLMYASSSFGGEALTQSRSLWLLYFYTEANDYLSPFAVGTIITVARLLETVDDGLIGYWSDRTRSRLGRRIPFILAATPFWALFGFLLFTPPTSGGAATAAYLFIVLELYFLASTLSGGPYEALLPEIAPSSAERVAITGMRVYFGAAGAAFGLVVTSIVKDNAGFTAMAALVAIVALTFRYLGLAGAWPYASRTQPPAKLRLGEALRTTFSNRAFLCFLPAFALFQLGFQVLLGALPFLVEAVLGPEDEGAWVAALSAVAVGTMVVLIPVAGLVAKRTTKRYAYRVSLLAAALLFPLLAFAGFLPGIPVEAQLVGAMVLAGLPIAGNYLFPAPLIADIIDDDSLRTGLRREATYYGAQNFVEKTTSALAPLVLGILLELGRSADDPLGVRLAGPVAGLLVLAGFLAFRGYDLPDDVLGGRPEEARRESG
ncbi:MAG: sugar transporter [Gaiellaceae bacterium]|jgi:GPH family glycoside/pentoside/hexuronide:cation symporter|nr:MAG: sugar transporter [Gaiellaceae bacterium]